MMRIAVFCAFVTAANALTFAHASAETFILANDKVLRGTAVQSAGGTLTIKLNDLGMRQVPLSSIRKVEITAKDGPIITGQLVSWSKGLYRLIADQGQIDVWVEGGLASRVAEVEERSLASTSGEQTIKAGFLYAGPTDDGGKTYEHERGRQVLAQAPNVTGTMAIDVIAEEPADMATAVERLVNEGSNVIFMAGHGSTDGLTDLATTHSDVIFVQCTDTQPLPNIAVYCLRNYEARYLAGIVAGGMTRSNLIGYVAAFRTPGVVSEINAFALGVRSVNPDALIAVAWTGTWYGPGIERAKAEALFDGGVDVLTIHQDSPAALQVAELRGKMAIGYHHDMSAFAPNATLTSAVWDSGVMYQRIADDLHQGQLPSAPLWWGLNDDVVGLAPLSAKVPAKLANLVKERWQELIDGQRHVFMGPIQDNGGGLRLAEDQVMSDSDLLTMDFLIEGVTDDFDPAASR